MYVNVVYLGGSRGQTGCAKERLEISSGSTVQDAIQAIAARHAGLGAYLPRVRWARNFEFATGSEALVDGDELALVPPVCGGAPRAQMTHQPLSVRQVQAQVASAEFGATVLFLGTVRNHHHGRRVQALTYEAYEPMAARQLERICEAVSVHPIEVYVAHRIGTLQVGELSLIIAAAAPHREQAYEASRATLERIKTDVPIFKRELRDDGEVWEGWGGG